MKNLKRLAVMFLAVMLVVGLCVAPASAANSNQAALHAAANVLRDDLGYPNDHACVRTMSATWNVEDGKSVGESYYYSSRTNAYYYFGKTNSVSGLFTGGGTYSSSNRSQQAAASVVNSLVAIYGQYHPTVAAASDIFAAECGISASRSYFYFATEGKFYYFSGSYERGNNTNNGFDDGTHNNLPGTNNPTEGSPSGTTTDPNQTTGPSGLPADNNGTNPGTNSGPATGANYALYAAQNYYNGTIFKGTEPYVDANAVAILAKFISSYGYSEKSLTRQAALGWTLINYMTGRTWDEATVKAAYGDYNSNAPTTDAYGRDIKIFAGDLLFRRNAERAGVAEVGRVLPKDYARLWITYEGAIYFRNQGGENAPNWGFTLRSPYNS